VEREREREGERSVGWDGMRWGRKGGMRGLMRDEEMRSVKKKRESKMISRTARVRE